MRKRIFSFVLSVAMTAVFTAGCGSVSNSGGTKGDTSPAAQEKAGDAGSANQTDEKKTGDYTIAVVPKLTALAWYERMEEGVKEYADEHGVDVFYTGPSEADGALQAQCIEDLISQGVDAICVVPFSTESLESVLKKARDQGIVVITHEAPGMTNIDYDIEAFNNDDYGRHLMEALGKAAGGQGEYIQTVGALTSTSHMEWVKAGETLQQNQFPNMKRYGDLIETSDSQDTAYNKVKEALTANPGIVGIQGSAMPDVAGAALAVEEMGLSGKVKIVGTALVSNAGQYVKDGTIDLISFWDPALAGKAMVETAVKVLNGETIKDGSDLGVDGYHQMKLDGNVLIGNAWIDVTAENADDPAYGF